MVRYVGTRRNPLWPESAVTAFNLVMIGNLTVVVA